MEEIITYLVIMALILFARFFLLKSQKRIDQTPGKPHHKNGPLPPIAKTPVFDMEKSLKELFNIGDDDTSVHGRKTYEEDSAREMYPKSPHSQIEPTSKDAYPDSLDTTGDISVEDE